MTLEYLCSPFQTIIDLGGAGRFPSLRCVQFVGEVSEKLLAAFSAACPSCTVEPFPS